MKLWMLPVAAIVGGTLLGSSIALLKYQTPELVLAGHTTTSTNALEPMPTTEARPRVYLPDPTSFDFGIMARNETGSHAFKVQNIGNGPLTLKVLNTTCKCTVGSLERDEIAAGETVDITLTWETRSYDREFRQSANIETSDQSQREITFTVHGQVLQLAAPDTPAINFQRLSRSEPKRFEFNVYGYRDEDLQITSERFSDTTIQDFFTVQTEPLPRDQWRDPEAKSATHVIVDIAPGLPLGQVRQLMSLHTNKSDIAPLEVAIEMTIVSDISVLGGRNYNDETNVLVLGPVPKATGTSVKLHLMVKGRHRDEVKFTVAETDPPEALRAEIGEPRDINNGAVRMVPLTIIVPPNSPSVYRMGSKQGKAGRIVLDTQHPEIPQFEIRVPFVVEN